MDDKQVEYQGQQYSLFALAQLLTGSKWFADPRYFKYNGEWLNDIPHRMEEVTDWALRKREAQSRTESERASK